MGIRSLLALSKSGGDPRGSGFDGKLIHQGTDICLLDPSLGYLGIVMIFLRIVRKHKAAP